MDTDHEITSDQDRKTESLSELSSSSLLLLSATSAMVYLLLAMLIFYFFYDGELLTSFEHGLPVTFQLIIGTATGVLAAVLIMWVADRPPVSKVLNDFYLVREITKTRFGTFDRIQLSFFAGTGEELLFRGAIQPLLGIWLTSVIFVGIHGYFKFRKPGHWIFSGMMFGLSMLLGYLFEYAGLIAAMSAHILYDALMLWWVQKKREL